MEELNKHLKTKISTIVRTIILALALANQILTTCGKNPLNISETQLYELASLGASVVVTIWAWWKNNSFTKAAQLGDMLMEQVKDGDIQVIKAGDLDGGEEEPEEKG